MAYDRKYGKITTEFGNIGEDEPVVVFRGRDLLLPKVLAYYHLFCMKAESPRFHLDTIMDTWKSITEWQDNNSQRLRIPSSSAYQKRMSK